MKRILLLLTVAMLCNIGLFAESKITGTVVDKDNQPLMGVQVKSETGDVAVTTDLDGRFEITVPEGSKLVFSMLGTKSRTKEAADGMVVVMDNESGSWDWRKQAWNHIILAEYGFNVMKNGGHSLGIRYGMCHYAGWFVSAKYESSDFSFPTVEYTMDKGIVFDSRAGWGTPVMTGNSNFNQFTVSAGLLWRMYIPLYGYAGVGYGYRKTAYETTGRKWIYSAEDNRNLAVAEFGFMGDIYGFTLSAGCGLIFAERLEAYPTFGIGYTFPMKKSYSKRNAK